MDDNKKKFIPQLAIDTEFFHSAFSSLVWCKTKGAVRSDGAQSLKGSHRTGDHGRIFIKILRDTSFTQDLSNEPNFGLIYLALDSAFDVFLGILLVLYKGRIFFFFKYIKKWYLVFLSQFTYKPPFDFSLTISWALRHRCKDITNCLFLRWCVWMRTWISGFAICGLGNKGNLRICDLRINHHKFAVLAIC